MLFKWFFNVTQIMFECILGYGMGRRVSRKWLALWWMIVCVSCDVGRKGFIICVVGRWWLMHKIKIWLGANQDKIYAGLTWGNMQWYMSISHIIVQGNERFEI